MGAAHTAVAHVTVKPGETTPSTYQVFTVNVPNEKDIPTVSVRLVVPETITGVTPTTKAGWEIVTEKKVRVMRLWCAR